MERHEHDRDERAGVTVRPARPEDLAAVGRLAGALVRLHHELDPQRFLLVDRVEEGYRWYFSRELTNPDVVILVATRAEGADGAGERVVGYAYGRKEERNWNALLDVHGGLHDIYVDEAERGGGVARKLVEAMVERLAALGAPRVVLMTAQDNRAAQALFERCGFRRTMVEMTRETSAAEGAAEMKKKP